MKSGKSIIMNAILLFSVIATTIVYSAYNIKLQVDGEAILRSENEIRITGVRKVEYTNGAYETYSSKYSKDTVSFYATLPANSSITYEVDITNKSTTVDYELDEIETLTNSNPNIIIESNINIWDNINKNSNKKFYITFKNNTASIQEINFTNQYKFSAISLPVFMSFYNMSNYSEIKEKFHDDMYRSKIREISLLTVSSLDEIIAPEEAIVSWNLDEADKGKIIGYLLTDINNPSMYDLYIVGYNSLMANSKSGYLFGNLSSLEKINDLDILDTKLVTNMNFMFANSKSLKTIDVSNFNTNKVSSMVRMFGGCQSLEFVNLEGFSTANVYNMNGMFYDCSSLKRLDLSGFDTSKTTNMLQMFYECRGMEELNLSSFNTKIVTDMGYMFCNCQNLENIIIDLSKFNTSNVTNMYMMFAGCYSLKTLDLSKFNTDKVTNMYAMFQFCHSLIELDLSSFNTKNVVDMHKMFAGCYLLEKLDISNFNTEKVTDMSEMFSGCMALEKLDLSGFNTKNVATMNLMFLRCYKLDVLDLSSFNTENVTDMSEMFAECQKLTKIYVGDNWSIANVTTSNDMFRICYRLSGAISYDENKWDATVANYTDGYLTYKA